MPLLERRWPTGTVRLCPRCIVRQKRCVAMPINLATARTLGVEVSQSLIARADEVIE
jgi:hypothetical protein